MEQIENQNNTISVREIWIRYALVVTISAALIAGFLYFVPNEESRFRIGGLLLPILALVTGFMYDYKLPKEHENLDLLLMATDISILIFGAIIVWIIVREIHIPQPRVYAIVANSWAWLCVWGLIATSRLRMGLLAVNRLNVG